MSCTVGGYVWILGKISSLKGLERVGTGCPGKWLIHHPWRFFKKMWHTGLWFSGGLGGAGLMVGLDSLKGLFQPKQL